MAKININLPEPSPLYDPNNQQQTLLALDTLRTQLNYSFQEELKQEMQRFSWYNARYGC